MSGFFNGIADLLEFGPPAEPTCRYHGQHCQMGANWPLHRSMVDPVGVQLDELLDLHRQGRRNAGLPVGPHPRDLWEVDRHEQVPAAELAQRDRELAEALTVQQAKNEAVLAQLRAERP